MNPVHEHEVVILGGGPAGSAAATLLAQRSHKVALVRPATTSAGALAESVPPSARKLLAELGLLGAIDDAGLHPNSGNTVWWAGQPARTESFGGGEAGFHTDRQTLERTLTRAAEAVGVRVYDATARSAEESEAGWSIRCDTSDGQSVELRTGWLLDATGRHGLVARREGREPDRSTTTIALVRRWKHSAGWPAGTEAHTLVESYEDGWAWSVPLDPATRCVTAMVDQRHAELDGVDVSAMLDTELAKTRHLGPMLEGAAPEGDAWACPASLYTSTTHARKGLLLVGDAGSFIDPLSSYGVKKALSSGWLAGVVAHTALVDAPQTEVAVRFFDDRERAVYRAYRRVSAAFFAEADAVYDHPYWRMRADAAGGTDAGPGVDPDDILSPPVPEPDVRAAFEAIRDRERLAAREGPTLTRFERPTVLGHRVVLAEHLATEAYPAGMRYVRGVDLQKLVEIAPSHGDVPDGWTAYNAVAPPVTLPDYLTALATAFAAALLAHDDD